MAAVLRLLRSACAGSCGCPTLPHTRGEAHTAGLRVPLVSAADARDDTAPADRADDDGSTADTDADALGELPSYEAWVFRESFWVHLLLCACCAVGIQMTLAREDLSQSLIWTGWCAACAGMRMLAHYMTDQELAAKRCGRAMIAFIYISCLSSLYIFRSRGITPNDWMQFTLEDCFYLPMLSMIATTFGYRWYDYALILLCSALFDGSLLLSPPSDFSADSTLAYVVGMPYSLLPVAFLVFIAVSYTLESRQRKLYRSRRQYIHTEAARRAQERYVSALSHDFGTPTAGLEMCIERLERIVRRAEEAERQIDGEAVLKLLKSMRCAVDMLVLLKSKAIALSKATHNVPLSPELGPVDLREMMAKVSDTSMAMGKRGQNKVEFFVAPEVPQLVLTDGGWVLMMLINLLSNALKHQHAGLIRVSIEPAGGQMLRFMVADTGMGVAPELEDKLFQPFMQESKWSGGTGLGLFHVRALAESLKGSVSYRRNQPQGAIFIVEIPCPSAVDNPVGVSGMQTPSVAIDTDGVPPSVAIDDGGVPPSVAIDDGGVPPSVTVDGEGVPPSVALDNGGVPPSVAIDNGGASPSAAVDNEGEAQSVAVGIVNEQTPLDHVQHACVIHAAAAASDEREADVQGTYRPPQLLEQHGSGGHATATHPLGQGGQPTVRDRPLPQLSSVPQGSSPHAQLDLHTPAPTCSHSRTHQPKHSHDLAAAPHDEGGTAAARAPAASSTVATMAPAASPASTHGERCVSNASPESTERCPPHGLRSRTLTTSQPSMTSPGAQETLAAIGKEVGAQPSSLTAMLALGPTLIVEDHDLIREVTKERLLMEGAPTVLEAADGLQALEILHPAESMAPSWILMDVRMPFMDGITCTRLLRKGEVERGVPEALQLRIIGLTANQGDPVCERSCLAAGMHAVLGKPFEVRKLQAVMQEVLLKVPANEHELAASSSDG